MVIAGARCNEQGRVQLLVVLAGQHFPECRRLCQPDQSGLDTVLRSGAPDRLGPGLYHRAFLRRDVRRPDCLRGTGYLRRRRAQCRSEPSAPAHRERLAAARPYPRPSSKAAAASYAGSSYQTYLDTQIAVVGHGTADTTVSTCYNQQNANGYARLYGVSALSGSTTVSEGSGTAEVSTWQVRSGADAVVR